MGHLELQQNIRLINLLPNGEGHSPNPRTLAIRRSLGNNTLLITQEDGKTIVGTSKAQLPIGGGSSITIRANFPSLNAAIAALNIANNASRGRSTVVGLKFTTASTFIPSEGPITISIRLPNSAAAKARQQIAAIPGVTVASANPKIITTVLPIAKVGVPYVATIIATGGTAPILFSYAFIVPIGFGPTGLSGSPTGVITGVPIKAGSISVKVTATDAIGRFDAVTFGITISF